MKKMDIIDLKLLIERSELLMELVHDDEAMIASLRKTIKDARNRIDKLNASETVRLEKKIKLLKDMILDYYRKCEVEIKILEYNDEEVKLIDNRTSLRYTLNLEETLEKIKKVNNLFDAMSKNLEKIKRLDTLKSSFEHPMEMLLSETCLDIRLSGSVVASLDFKDNKYFAKMLLDSYGRNYNISSTFIDFLTVTKSSDSFEELLEYLEQIKETKTVTLELDM